MNYYIYTDCGFIAVNRNTALQYRKKATLNGVKLGFDQFQKARFYFAKHIQDNE